MNSLAIIDFYYLWALTNRDVFGLAASKAQEKAQEMLDALVPNLANALRDYAFLICVGEARYASTSGDASKGMRYKLSRMRQMTREASVEWAKKYRPSEASWNAVIKVLGETDTRQTGSVAGEKWAQIGRTAKDYSPSVVYVDTLINAQHNSGRAFDKTHAFYDVFLDDHFGPGRVMSFLGYKATIPDILHPPTPRYVPSTRVTNLWKAILGKDAFVDITSGGPTSHLYERVWGKKDLKASKNPRYNRIKTPKLPKPPVPVSIKVSDELLCVIININTSPDTLEDYDAES